jgi:hypothetical protein
VRRALAVKLKSGLAVYRALPEAERLRVARELLAEALKDSNAQVASVGAAGLLKRRFERVTAHDARQLVRGVRAKLREVEVGGARWLFVGVRRGAGGRKLVFVRPPPLSAPRERRCRGGGS